MGIIHLDFETYSDINIKKAGAFRYIQSPAFEILLCAYSVDDGPVRVLDLTVPQERDYFNTAFKDLIFRSDSVLMAYNAAFEAGCRFTWHFDNKERFPYRSTGPSKQNIIWLKQICRNIRIINITKRDRTPCHGIFVDIAYANHSDAALLFCWCIVPVLNGFCD